MPFDLDQLPSLALFARVAQLRSFTAAARQSGIAKSAVSKRIAQLEAAVGVQLLRRTTRKLALTEEGLRFYEHCARLLESARAAHESVATASESLRGVIRVSAAVTFAHMHLAGALAEFLLQHPEVEAQLSADDGLVDVVEGGFDVVVRVGRLPANAGFSARRLASDRLVVCGAPDYLERAGRPRSPDELVRHNCLHYERVPLSGEWRFRGEDGPYSVPVRGSLSSTDGTVLRRAALAGLGLAVLPLFMVVPDLRDGRLELVLEGHRRAEIGIHAVTAHGRRLPRRTRALIDFLARRFSRPGWQERAA